MFTLKEMVSAFAHGIEKVKEDEELIDGLPYCKKCKGKRFFCSDDGDFCMRAACNCQRERFKEEEEKKAREAVIEAYNDRYKQSLLGNRYKGARFNNVLITPNNLEVYTKAQLYIAQSKKMFVDNIGMYIYGSPSTGKTHLTAVICHELVLRGYNCVYTNLSSLLSEIWKDGLCGDLVYKFENYDFVFLDDLGKDFIGREFKESSAKWAESKLYELLNSRYNKQYPTIFTSNYSIDELTTMLHFDKAIVKRITEMSTLTYLLKNDDFRKIIKDNKLVKLKQLGF